MLILFQEIIKQRLTNMIVTPIMSQCNHTNTTWLQQLQNLSCLLIKAWLNIKGETEGVALAFLLITMMFGAMYKMRTMMLRFRRRDHDKKVLYTRSMSIGALRGGELAMQRLVEYHDARVNRALLHDAEDHLRSGLNRERPDFKQLRRIVGRLEMSGKEEKAVEILEGAVKMAREQGKPHEAYEFEMLLVETLIYKGDFRRALNCECLKYESITDARRPLFKAIIHLLLDDCEEEEVKGMWKEFRRIQKHFSKSHSSQASQFHEAAKSFTTFKNIVMSLKDDINRARTDSSIGL